MATHPTIVLSPHLAVASRLQGRDLVSSSNCPCLSLRWLILPRYLPVTLLDTTLPSLLATLAPADPADCPSPRSSAKQRGGRTRVKCAGRHPTEEKIRIRGAFCSLPYSHIHPFTQPTYSFIHPINPSIIRSFIPLPHLLCVREHVRVREVPGTTMHAMRMHDK